MAKRGRPVEMTEREVRAWLLSERWYLKLMKELGGQRLIGQVYQGKRLVKGDAEEIRDDLIKKAIAFEEKHHPQDKGELRFPVIKKKSKWYQWNKPRKS